MLIEPVNFKRSEGVNYIRTEVRLREYVYIASGFGMVVRGPFFRVRGYLRVVGVLIVER